MLSLRSTIIGLGWMQALRLGEHKCQATPLSFARLARHLMVSDRSSDNKALLPHFITAMVKPWHTNLLSYII